MSAIGQLINSTAKENMLIAMALYMKEHGSKVNNKEREQNSGLMELLLLEPISKERRKVQGISNGLTILSIKVNFTTIISMERALMFGMMEGNMKVIGLTIK